MVVVPCSTEFFLAGLGVRDASLLALFLLGDFTTLMMPDNQFPVFPEPPPLEALLCSLVSGLLMDAWGGGRTMPRTYSKTCVIIVLFAMKG